VPVNVSELVALRSVEPVTPALAPPILATVILAASKSRLDSAVVPPIVPPTVILAEPACRLKA